jgi:hypothetical protein
VEYAYPASLQAAIANDEELNRLLPFLALPDGAHLVSCFVRYLQNNTAELQSEEDYSYFVSFHALLHYGDKLTESTAPITQQMQQPRQTCQLIPHFSESHVIVNYLLRNYLYAPAM